ncbi:MAG: hypothetical protein LBJ92_02820 [Holosporales bacterium]|jgi:hypothetical protein|nr:hypothetical protein [Holosporales bacterium]
MIRELLAVSVFLTGGGGGVRAPEASDRGPLICTENVPGGKVIEVRLGAPPVTREQNPLTIAAAVIKNKRLASIDVVSKNFLAEQVPLIASNIVGCIFLYRLLDSREKIIALYGQQGAAYKELYRCVAPHWKQIQQDLAAIARDLGEATLTFSKRPELNESAGDICVHGPSKEHWVVITKDNGLQITHVRLDRAVPTFISETRGLGARLLHEALHVWTVGQLGPTCKLSSCLFQSSDSVIARGIRAFANIIAARLSLDPEYSFMIQKTIWRNDSELRVILGYYWVNGVLLFDPICECGYQMYETDGTLIRASHDEFDSRQNAILGLMEGHSAKEVSRNNDDVKQVRFVVMHENVRFFQQCWNAQPVQEYLKLDS